MSKSINQVNYDELQRIAKSLHGESEDIAHLHSATRHKMDALRSQWSGEAAEAFFREQEGQLLPAVQRVSRALGESETVLNQVMRIIHDADQETAGYFRGFDNTSTELRARILPALPQVDWLKGVHADVFGGKEGGILENTGPGGKFVDGRPELKLEGKVGIGGQAHDGGAYQLGKWDLGVKGGIGEKGLSAGVYGEFDAFKTEATGVIGSSMFGFTATGGASAGSVEGFVGLKDNDFGASVGGSVISGELGLGLNIAGFNVRVVGGLGAGVEFGFKIGDDTRVKVGPFKVGLSFGKALTNTVTGR